MSGVQNHTARQFNLKASTKSGARVTVRLKPGFNVVDDEHWSHIAVSPYAQVLKSEGKIDYNDTLDEDAELGEKGEVAQVKTVNIPKKKKSKKSDD